MTGVFSCTTILFFVVFPAPSVPADDHEGLCWSNMSYRQKHQVSYRKSSKHWWNWISYTPETKTEYYVAWKPAEVCCQDYKNINGTCKPQCSSACVNGYCSRPNTCECNYGWGFKTCNEPLVCVVASEAVREPPGSKSIENMTGNPLIERMEYACLPGCHDQLTSTDFNFTRTANMTYYFVPIDSPCNTETSFEIALKEYGYAVGAVIGIILCTIIVCFISVMRRKRKPRNKVHVADIPIQHKVPDYMLENTIYS